METYQEIITLRGDTGSIVSICFSPDGKILVSKSTRIIIFWDTVTYKEITTLHRYNSWIRSICFQPEQYEYLLK